jgi:hypothetical protein
MVSTLALAAGIPGTTWSQDAAGLPEKSSSKTAQVEGKTTTLRFEVSVAPGFLSGPTHGRLLVVLARSAQVEPRLIIGNTGLQTPPVLGTDANDRTEGLLGTLDSQSAIFPIPRLADLPMGEYYIQAVLDTSIDLKLTAAPGNLYSAVEKVKLDPVLGGTVKLALTKKVPPEELPPDADFVKYVKLKSELLTRFHGRPIYLRAGIILPDDFESDPARRYPLRVHIGGYGQRFTTAGRMMVAHSSFERDWTARATPRMILLHLDGAGPYGDPYQVNSANNGPYGDAITQELIPYVEKKYRGIGQPWARVLDGASTGGWVSLALQLFYPDFFNGAWSQCPDPVDFRSYELINIYEDANAYLNNSGFERPACRNVDGDVRYTVRHECQIENVIGRGNRWTLSGKDWCAWNAVYGPRGTDGLPKPLWDAATGKIDKVVLDHWKQYDLRLVLEKNWPTLAPKLRGKIHIWVGDADDYFLNNAVHRLDRFLRTARPPFGGKIVFGARQGHTAGWSAEQVVTEMAQAIEQAQPKEPPKKAP